jgi:hypothetical protein
MTVADFSVMSVIDRTNIREEFNFLDSDNHDTVGV